MLTHQFNEVLRSIFHINHTICCLQLTINERVRESLQWGWVLIKNRGMLNLQSHSLVSSAALFCHTLESGGGEMGMVGIMPLKPPSPLKTILPWTPWKIVLDLPLH